MKKRTKPDATVVEAQRAARHALFRTLDDRVAAVYKFAQEITRKEVTLTDDILAMTQKVVESNTRKARAIIFVAEELSKLHYEVEQILHKAKLL